MFKRMIILAVLSVILAVLIFIKPHSVSPDNSSNTKSNTSTGYTTIEYTITKISGKQYYGEADDGKRIHFSGDNIPPGENIQVHDKVVCYFEKNNLGKGIVKVEKK
jgi:hypothetical protein